MENLRYSNFSYATRIQNEYKFYTKIIAGLTHELENEDLSKEERDLLAEELKSFKQLKDAVYDV